MTLSTENIGVEKPPQPSRLRGNTIFGILLIGLGIAWLLDRLDVYEIEPRIILPMALVVVGLALMIGAFDGPHPGLMVTAIVLGVAVVLTAAFPFAAFREGVGDRVHRITTQSELEPQYRLGLGDLRLDLSALELAKDTTVEADLGAGKLSVILPEGVAVDVAARVNAGQITIFDQRRDGLNVEHSYQSPGYEQARVHLTLDLEVITGEIEVRS